MLCRMSVCAAMPCAAPECWINRPIRLLDTCRNRPIRLADTCKSIISCCVLLLGMVCVVSARSNNGQVKMCNEVHNRCFGRDGCKFALENYFVWCMDISDGEAFQCTERCKMALIMLLSSDEHDGPNAFRDCDCQDDEFCLQQKDRIAVCADDVQSWLDAIRDPDARINCYLAGLVCSADTPCLAAIEYYHDHCKKLQDPNNPRCTSRCNNSLNILYRQSKAQKLRNCYCDGTEGYNCTALKDNTQNLCFAAHETSTPLIRHPGHHNHTRAPPGPDIPVIQKEVPPPRGSARHNSAYTIHSRGSAPLCLKYKQSAHFLIVLAGLMFVLLNR